MSTNEINDWRYPPVPQAVREALKDHPELIAEIERRFSDPSREHGSYAMSDSLTLSDRVDCLHWVTTRLKDGLSAFLQKARSKLETAQKIGDAAAIATAGAEREAIAAAQDMDVEYWDEFMAFYGLEDNPIEGRGMRIKEGV